MSKPAGFERECNALEPGSAWPSAAWGESGRVEEVRVSEYPLHLRYKHLLDVVDARKATPLSHRGALGFLGRTGRGTLRFDPRFLADVAEHVQVTAPDNAQLSLDLVRAAGD
jgi:DNA (cytosine-5)-methyltransferase 1